MLLAMCPLMTSSTASFLYNRRHPVTTVHARSLCAGYFYCTRVRSRMRIAMMTDSWYPTRDGVVTSVSTIKRSLEALGHEVFIVAPEPEDEYKQEGVYYFPAIRFKTYEGYYVPIIPARNIDALRKIDPDIIHIHGVATMAIRGLVYGRILHIPTVMTFHTMVDDAARFYSPVPIRPDALQRWIWIYLRHVIKHVDVLVTPTACIGDELKNHQTEFRNLVTIPTGIDTTFYRPGIDCGFVRERHGLGDRKVVIHVGRISYEKNLELVIRAMINIDGVLLVCGRGPAKEESEELVEWLGLKKRVIFAGFVPDEELPAYYNAADCAVSASGFETQGLSILEAMSCRKAVACMDARAFSEIIRDGENGYLFNDLETCIDAIRKALDAPEDVKDGALRTALATSREESARKYVQAYELAIETKARHSG